MVISTASEHSAGGAIRAGAGRATIELDGILPQDEFTIIADQLATRVLVLDSPDGRAVIAVVDITSIPARTLSILKRALASAASTTTERVLVVASHTFSAPHIHPHDHHATASARARARNDEYEQRVVSAATAAALQATAHLRPAHVETASGLSEVAVNRDIETDDGWGLGINVDGPTDPEVSVLAIRTRDETPIAVIVNYAVQPAAMNGSRSSDGGLIVSADIAGAVAERIEQLLPGSTAFFLPGAGGDQAPAHPEVPQTADPSTIVERVSQSLTAEVLRVLPYATRSRDQRTVRIVRASITVDGQHPLPRPEIRPTRSHSFTAAGPRELPFAILQVGDARLLFVQPELSVSTGRAIKDATRATPTFVVTMADGAAKYMPEASAYPRFTYEALSSWYAQGSAEELTEAAVPILAAADPAQQHA